jgi:hypothetical protein
MIIKDASNLIARGQFKDALPVTMDAIVTAQAIYYPNAPLQLVPIYLLAVQVCEFFLHNLPLNLFLVSHEHSKFQVLLFSFFFFPGCVGVKSASISLFCVNLKVNLGLERPIQSEDLLGIGSWLLLQDSSDQPKDAIRAELSRLLGQLSLLKVWFYKPKKPSRNILISSYLNSFPFLISWPSCMVIFSFEQKLCKQSLSLF